MTADIGGSEQEEDLPEHLGQTLTDLQNQHDSQQAQSLMKLPPGRNSLPSRPSTVPNAVLTSDGDMVFAPGMPAPADASETQRAVTFAQLRARDSQLGFGSVASSGVLQILDKHPSAVVRAASAATAAARSVQGDTGARHRHSTRPSAARPGASGQVGAVHTAHGNMVDPRAALPARPRTVGSGFRTSTVRGTVAVSERSRFVSSEGSKVQHCAAISNAHDGDGNAGAAHVQRGKRSPERRGASVGAHVAAGASMGIDVRHVQRQVRSALQHGGELVVEVGSVVDGCEKCSPEAPRSAAKGRPEPAHTGLLKGLLGSHTPSIGRESNGSVQKR